jgi:hypothetical protein
MATGNPTGATGACKASSSGSATRSPPPCGRSCMMAGSATHPPHQPDLEAILTAQARGILAVTPRQADLAASARPPNSGGVCAGQRADEPACRPGSVHPLARAGGHPSGTAVAGSLVRSTREHRAGRPRTLAQAPRPGEREALLTLLRVGLPGRSGHPGAGGLSHHQRSRADLHECPLTLIVLHLSSVQANVGGATGPPRLQPRHPAPARVARPAAL